MYLRNHLLILTYAFAIWWTCKETEKVNFAEEAVDCFRRGHWATLVGDGCFSKHSTGPVFDHLCSQCSLIVLQSMLIASHPVSLNVSAPCSYNVIHRSLKMETRLNDSKWRGRDRANGKRTEWRGQSVCLEWLHHALPTSVTSLVSSPDSEHPAPQVSGKVSTPHQPQDRSSIYT